MNINLQNPGEPFVSVIIPVLTNADGLRRCLKPLNQQSYAKDKYEILVVDNGSTDNIDDVVNAFSQAKLLSEVYPSQAAARNTGLLAAKGEIVALTDSDCIPALNWIENGIGKLVHAPECDYVGGKISIFFRDPHKPTACELYESLFAFPQEKYIREIRYSTTANLFARMSVFNDVGLFNPASYTGSDEEWGKKVYARGYKQFYAENAEIRHPARRSWKQLSSKQARIRVARYKKSLQKKPLTTIWRRFLWVIKSPLLSRLHTQIRITCSDTRLSGFRQRLSVASILCMRVCFDYLIRFSVVSGIHVEDDYEMLRGRSHTDLLHEDTHEKTIK